MKTIDLDDIAKSNSLVDKDQVIEALAIIKKIVEEGIAPMGARGCDPFEASDVPSDPNFDPRTVKLRFQL